MSWARQGQKRRATTVRVLKDRMYWKAILNRMKHFDL